MSVYKLLDRILSLVENSPSIPFLGVKLIGNSDLQNLIEQAVSELPEELAEAKQLVSHEEQILYSARKQAEQILQKAHMDANNIISSAYQQLEQIVNESEVIKAISSEAEKIRTQVRIEAQRISQETEREIAQAEEDSRRQIQRELDIAIMEAENTKRAANSYAEAVLYELERTTSGAISMIQNGQKQLEQISKQNLRAEQLGKFSGALAELKNLHSDLLIENLPRPKQNKEK